LGYPMFNHYAALPFYIAACFNLIGLDLLTAIKLTQTLGFVVAALAAYAWLYHLWRRRAAAWLGAVAYTVAPFHLVNVYVRGDSLSEFFAFAFYPLILWALDKVVERSSFGSAVRLALAYAGLALTHNISALIFSPFILLYLVLSSWRKPKVWRTLGLGLGGVLLGLALSAWFWLPAILEGRYVQLETVTLDYFNYTNHFRSTDLVQPHLLFDYSIAPTPGGAGPFAMGSLQALVAAVGLLILVRFALDRERAAEERIPFVYLIIGLLVSTVMITPLSRPLWDHLPLLDKVQFPWRFLSVQALFAAVAAGVLTLRLKGRWAWGAGGAIAGLLVASTLLPLRPERLPIGPADITTIRLQEYELFTGNIGTTIRYEYLPRETVPRPFTYDAVVEPEALPRPLLLGGTLVDVEQTQRRPVERLWRVRAGEDGATLAFPLLYWPGWRAWVDGEETRIWAVEGAGYLALDVPAGEHDVRLKLGRTSLRAGAETLSLLTLLLLSFTLWRFKAHLRLRAPSISAHSSLMVSSLFILFIGLLPLVLRSSPPPNRPDDLTMDFVAMPYLHHNPDGVRFADPADVGGDDQARLLSYTFSADQLAPGDTLTVALKWDDGQQGGDGVQVSLRLVSPAGHLQKVPYVLAESSVPLGSTTVHRLPVPENTPRGLYLLQLRLWGPDGELSPRTPLGEGRGALYLRPVRVTQGALVPPDAPLLAILGPDIRLHVAELEPDPESDHLTVRLEWSTAGQLTTNYGVSVRLLDPNGGPREALDTQPGYGFAPTSQWRPGERVADRYTMSLPDDLPPGDGYRLVIVFYQFPSVSEVARVGLGPFALPLESPVVFEPPPRLFELPPLSHPLEVDYGDQIILAGYELELEAETLDLTLWWVAQRQLETNYTVFVHLFDPATNAIPTQYDAMPRQGSYPTSGWLAGEVVSDTVRLSLSDVPPGDYRLAAGLYQVATRDRLPAVGPDGVPLPDGRLILPDEIEVSGE